MDWLGPLRFDLQMLYDIVVTTVIVYGFIIFAVRLLGVRSISHLNNFDWIVAVAIGAISGSSLVSPSVTATQAIVAIAALFIAQYAVTWMASHSDMAAKILKADPHVLVRDGKVDTDALAKARLTEAEVLAEVRGKGLSEFSAAKTVVLESDSTISVVPKDDSGGGAKQTALQTVEEN